MELRLAIGTRTRGRAYKYSVQYTADMGVTTMSQLCGYRREDQWHLFGARADCNECMKGIHAPCTALSVAE